MQGQRPLPSTAEIGAEAAIATLLSRFRRSGLLLAAAIMMADVAANTYALVALNIRAFSLAVPLQAIFLGFVLGSLPFLWPRRESASGHIR